jgi:aspartate-semialdehyde dehydrogenase
MVEETKKIMEADIQVSATCVRVPVFVGHSESVNIEFEKPITAEQARDLLEGADGITMYDDHKDGGYCSPMECAGEDAVFISRLRQDTSVKHGLAMWIVSDNLRKGAALNAVQIAEALIEEHGLAPKKKN